MCTLKERCLSGMMARMVLRRISTAMYLNSKLSKKCRMSNVTIGDPLLLGHSAAEPQRHISSHTRLNTNIMPSASST